MGKPFPYPAQIVVGFLAGSMDVVHRACSALEPELGPVIAELGPWPFDYTDYYSREMGDNLIRCWRAFSVLCRRNFLASLKRFTCAVEDSFKNKGNRTVNIDPGLLSEHNFVLASTKNAAHRVYLGEGIFAELTLVFESGGFLPLKWTYPDYRDKRFLEFAFELRKSYRDKIDEKLSIKERFWPSRA